MLSEKNGKKGAQAHFNKMVKNALAGPKNNHMAKMSWECVNTDSGITHTKFQSSAREK